MLYFQRLKITSFMVAAKGVTPADCSKSSERAKIIKQRFESSQNRTNSAANNHDSRILFGVLRGRRVRSINGKER